MRPVRIGFLVPPGNPTVEVEMIALAPARVSVHFTRMVAHGAAGSHQGQEERNRSQIAHLHENVRLLAMVGMPTPLRNTACACGTSTRRASPCARSAVSS